MLVSVTFYVGMRDDWYVGSRAVKTVWKKKESYP
jgi:hypothetical protein